MMVTNRGVAALMCGAVPLEPPENEVVSRLARNGADGVDWQLSFPGKGISVPLVRLYVRAALIRAEATRCLRRADAELIGSELATNAIQHTPCGDEGKTFTVRIQVQPGWLRLDVGALGPADWDQPTPPDTKDESGRGLLIVKTLADKAGRFAAQGGHISWAELSW